MNGGGDETYARGMETWRRRHGELQQAETRIEKLEKEKIRIIW